MHLSPEYFVGRPIKLQASLLGAHVIMAPAADRILAVMLTAQFRTYTLFIRQASDGEVELELEETPARTDQTHPQSIRSQIIER